MAETMMAYPELRHPYEETPIHPPGSTTVLYQGRAGVPPRAWDSPPAAVRSGNPPRFPSVSQRAASRPIDVQRQRVVGCYGGDCPPAPNTCCYSPPPKGSHQSPAGLNRGYQAW